MTEAQLVEAISARFVAAWATSHPTGCPVALEGEFFDAEDQWVRVSIVPVDGEQRSMGPVGDRLVGDSGFVAVEVYAPAGGGTAGRAALCDDVRTALQFQSLGASGERVRLFKGVSKDPSTEGRWLRQTVLFAYDCMSTA